MNSDLFAFLDEPAGQPARKSPVRKAKAPTKSAAPILSGSFEPAQATPEKEPEKQKKLSAASASALDGVYTRNLAEWLQREDDCLIESVLADPHGPVKKSRSKTSLNGNVNAADGVNEPNPTKPTRLNDFAVKFSRDPVLVMRRIIDFEIPAMAGIEMELGSEEASEFMGLAFAGVPLNLALRWCAATEDQADRPTWEQIQAAMTEPDRRAAMRLVQSTGMWFSSAAQLWSLDMLAEQNEGDVHEAVLAVSERLDAPTPDVVSQQMFGAFADEEPVDWEGMPKGNASCFMSDLFAAPCGAGGAPGRRGRGRRSYSSSSSTSTSAAPGSAEYSANPGNWGGKKKSYYRKKRSTGTRTVRAGSSYTSFKGKSKKSKKT